MDYTAYTPSALEPLTCIDMHTGGMPTRVVVKGFPTSSGTLLEQKAQAAEHHDHIRKRLILEPRGHVDMYGAVLCPETELTVSGGAHMGVLYIQADGYSNMCGHATVALSRLLVDTHDPEIFPQRQKLVFDPVSKTVRLVLHTPGGLVQSDVPTTSDGARSDPTRPIAFNTIPAIALVNNLKVPIRPDARWPELGAREEVYIHLAYCSAVSCHVTLEELGFPPDTFHNLTTLDALKRATQNLKDALNKDNEAKSHLKIPGQDAPVQVFGVMVTDKDLGKPAKNTKGVETGVYIFGDQHVDRSPTGSVAAARNALAYAEGKLGLGDSWTYHSLLSHGGKGEDGFVATTLKEVNFDGKDQSDRPVKGVIVRIEGFASYTGFHTFIMEKEDHISRQGFLLH